MNVRRHEGKHADFYELLPAIDTFVSEYRLQVDLESFRDCFSFCSIAQIQQTHESFIIAMLAKYLSLIDTSVVAVIPLTSNTRFSCCHDIQYTACHHLPRFNLGFRAFLLVLVAEARGARVVPAPRLLLDRVVVEGIDTLCVREHRRALRSGRQG